MTRFDLYSSLNLNNRIFRIKHQLFPEDQQLIMWLLQELLQELLLELLQQLLQQLLQELLQELLPGIA